MAIFVIGIQGRRNNGYFGVQGQLCSYNQFIVPLILFALSMAYSI